MPVKQKLVVIGNGMAGARFVEDLLARGGSGQFEIVMFGDEPYGNYNRILLSGVLSGTHQARDIFINPPAWYDENDITLHAGVRVERIDRAVKQVIGAGGVVEAYDKLVIATGSSAFVPPMEGLKSKAGKGKVDALLWVAGQSGAIAAEVGYSFAGNKFADKLKPWIRGGYFRSTGDGDPNDSRHGTFFQVLPTPHIYARAPFFNSMNNEDAFGQLRIKPHAKLGVRFDAHHLRLSNAKDLWYVGGGAFQKRTFGYVGRPSNGKQSLGRLFDASADLALSARTSFTFYFGGIRGGGVQSAIYPLGGANPLGRFAYVELTQKF